MKLENDSPYYRNIKLRTFLTKLTNDYELKIVLYSYLNMVKIGEFEVKILLSKHKFIENTFIADIIIRDNVIELCVYRWDDKKLCIY